MVKKITKKLIKITNASVKNANDVIVVKNVAGTPDTTAKILVQNRIDFVPKVSVIIPVYNIEKYLRECLDSVCGQTLKEIEIICVDDGSTDSSLEILKEYAKKDNRITVITQKNLHAGVARNAGLTVASGEYLSFLDSDDYFDLNMLEEAYLSAQRDKSDVVVFQFNMKNYTNNTTVSSMGIKSEIVSKKQYVISPMDYKEDVFDITNPTPWNKIFRREFVNEYNIKFQNLNVCNDLYFVYAAISVANNISIVPKSMLNYRYMQKNSLSNSRQKYPYNFVDALNELYLFIVKNGHLDSYRQSFMKSLFNSIEWTAKQQISKKTFFDNFPKDKPVIQEFSFLLDIAKSNGKKIYLVSQPQIVDTVGGAITALINMGKFLKQYNFDITCICYANTPKIPDWANELKFVNLHTYVNVDLNFSGAINKYLTENRPDLMIFFFPMFLREANLMAEFDNIPKILMFHSRPDWYIDRMNEQERHLFKQTYKNVTAQVLMNSFVPMLPDYIRKGNVVTIGNIVKQQSEYKDKSENKKIVYLSRVDKYKGLEFLINSYVYVAKNHPDWELHIYGQAEPVHYLYQLQDMVECLGLSHCIKFMGVVPNVMETLQEYDFCVFPSYFEGFGIGLAEALSSGLPAIGLKGSSAVNEIIVDGENGFLVDEVYTDFAEKINKLIEDKHLRLKMQKNAVDSVKKYSAGIIYQKWLRTIAAILNDEKIKDYENKVLADKYTLFPISHILESSKNNRVETHKNKISVIIPVYNVEAYLAECLDSVLNQTLKEIEIICVNDGSKDNSLAILQDYASRDNRIKIINQKNQGLSCSRNNAMKIATGKYIVFLDSDDYIAFNSLEKIYNQMSAYNLDMLSFSGVNFVSDTRQITVNPYWDFNYLPQGFNTAYFNIEQCWDFLHKMAVSSCLTAYKASFVKFNDLRFPDGLCFEDNLFFIKSITKATRCGIIKDKFYFRRIHDESITQNWDVHFMDWIKINDLVLEYLSGLNIKETILQTNINVRCGSVLTRFEHLSKKDQQKMFKSVVRLLMKYKFYKIPAQKSCLKSYLLFPYYLCANWYIKNKKIPQVMLKKYGKLGGCMLKGEKISELPDIFVDEIISLGPACRPAYQLKNNGLRRHSYPFDYMINHNLNLIVDTLKSKTLNWFYNFTLETRACGIHHIVTDNHTKMISMHHFPLKYSVKDYLPIFNDIFNRRKNRLCSALSIYNDVCFVMNRTCDVIEMLQFIKSVSDLYPNTSLTLINVRQDESCKDVYKYTVNDKCVCYDIHCNDVHDVDPDSKTNRNWWVGSDTLWRNLTAKLHLNRDAPNIEVYSELEIYTRSLDAKINLLQKQISDLATYVQNRSDGVGKQISDLATYVQNRSNGVDKQISDLATYVQNKSDGVGKQISDLATYVQDRSDGVDKRFSKIEENVGLKSEALFSQVADLKTIIKSETDKLFKQVQDVNNKHQIEILSDKLDVAQAEIVDRTKSVIEHLAGAKSELVNKIDTLHKSGQDANNNIVNEIGMVKGFADKLAKRYSEPYWANVYHDTINNTNWLNNKSVSPGRWAVSYVVLYVLYRILDEIKPQSILECGLGQSSKLTIQYADSHKADLTICENNSDWLSFFQRQFPTADIYTKILDTEMINIVPGYESRTYVGFDNVIKNKKFDFVLIDGPLGSQHYSRPEVLSVVNNLDKSFVILMDDMNRVGEQETFEALKNKLRENNIDFKEGFYESDKRLGLICSPDLEWLTTL